MEKEQIKAQVKERFYSIRIRTIVLTLSIVISMVLFFLVTVGFNDTINWVDFIFLATLQVITHCIYFPDGDLFGQQDKIYQANKKAYNENATRINKEKKIEKLREYCKVECELRKKSYIENELAVIGITEDEFIFFRSKTEEEIKKTKVWEIDGAMIVLSRTKRIRLYKLLFKEIPVEANTPETIMSAIENSGRKAIHDKTKSYNITAYIRKVLMAFVVGGFLAYIGYSLKDTFTLADVVRIFVYLTSIVSTAVMSYSAGEKSSKVYKTQFYIALILFIDGFFEWTEKGETIIMQNIEKELQESKKQEITLGTVVEQIEEKTTDNTKEE